MNSTNFMKAAIDKARESVSLGGFPAGAIVVKNGKIVGEGISIGNKLNDPTSHGEMSAIRNACSKLRSTDLTGTTLYASMQPCVMCLGASMWSSILKIVYACKQESVSKEYYGGHYKSELINKEFIRPIEISHLPEFEIESLNVVKEWEKKI